MAKIIAYGNGGRDITQKKCREEKVCMICGKVIPKNTVLYEIDTPFIYPGRCGRKGIDWFCAEHDLPKIYDGEEFTLVEDFIFQF